MLLQICATLFVLVISSAQYSHAQSAWKCNKPCVNGVCFQFKGTSPRCLCRNGYVGELCQNSRSPAREQQKSQCKLNCKNGGTCNAASNKCNCRPGYTGQVCQYRYDIERVCEKNSVKLMCTKEEKIVIDYALWGRRAYDKDNCRPRGFLGRLKLPKCGSELRSKQYVDAKCAGKTSCLLYAINRPEIGGDPCKRIPKYLEVNWHCEPDIKRSTWMEWGKWSECSKTCGGGTRSRSRQCDKREETKENCRGVPRQDGSCNTQRCAAPNERKWTNWGAWSLCSAECGKGQMSRTRQCVIVPDMLIITPAECGDGSLAFIDKQDCYGSQCPLVPEMYQWGEWSSFGECSQSCGPLAIKQRTRACLRLGDTPAQMLDAMCSLDGNLGNPSEVVGCELAPCPAVVSGLSSSSSSSASAAQSSSSTTSTTTLAPAPKVPRPDGGRGGSLPSPPSPVDPPIDGSNIAGGSVWGYMMEKGGYCDVTDIAPIKFMSLEDCADACYQFMDCRGVTHNNQTRHCYVLTKMCDNPISRDPRLKTYVKIEPTSYICGLAECRTKCTQESSSRFSCSEPQDGSVVGYITALAFDEECAMACSADPSCMSFEWGPGHRSDESEFKYRFKSNYLNCILYKALNNQECHGFQASAKSRYCKKVL